MEDRFKERIAAALMGDLLVALARREKIKAMLGDLEGWAADDLIKQLLDEFEKIIGELRDRTLEQQSRSAAETSGSPENISAATPEPMVAEQTLPPPYPEVSDDLPGLSETGSIFGLAGELAESGRDLLGESFPPTPGSPSRQQEVREPEPSEKRGVADNPVPDVAEEAHVGVDSTEGDKELTEEILSVPPANEPVPEMEKLPVAPSVSARLTHPKIPYVFADDEIVYIHGTLLVPAGESPSAKPFILEEKGIEDRDFAFAIDHLGLRFYLSKVHIRSSHISKTGTLLLSKQESIMMRGRHESILNELRAHGVFLPFEFGTVARGKDELFEKIDAHLDDLFPCVEEIVKTTWWELNVFVLDAKVSKMVKTETSGRTGRERSRPSFSSLSTSKVDIKMLERMLGKQKKIAEAVHGDLSAMADRSDIDMKISLGSGTSEDWKLILKASYEVPLPRFASFNRVLTDLQYRHFTFDVMLTLTGEREPFSFQS